MNLKNNEKLSDVNEPNKLFFEEGSNNQPNHRLQTNKMLIMSEIIDKFIIFFRSTFDKDSASRIMLETDKNISGDNNFKSLRFILISLPLQGL